MVTTRRSILKSAALCACVAPWQTSLASAGGLVTPAPLKSQGQQNGRLIGVFAGAYLKTQTARAEVVAREFSLIADGNDLKFSDRLRPTPTTYDFSAGDWTIDWAQQHGLLFRGHCLLWWNGLPKWFNGYVNPGNAKQVMVDHINTVVKHYAGRMYSWDVLNEPIYHDGRPDGLRRKPWLDLLGPEYIDIAFHTAAAADPKARLLVNECYIEHNTPAEIGRRAQLLELATRLKASNVPVSGIGIQGHIRGNTPIDGPGMTVFLKKIQDLGLDIMVTELDVDDVDVPAPMIDSTVASKYTEFINLVGPFASSISFQNVADDPTLPKRPDGLSSRPDLFDSSYQAKSSYTAAAQALAHLQRTYAIRPKNG